MSHWSNVDGSDASWPALDISNVLSFAAAAPSSVTVWQSCLSRVDDPSGGVDFVPVAQAHTPCWVRTHGAIVAQELSTLTAANASMERKP